MIVKCLANTGADLPPEYLDPAGGYHAGVNFDITPGQDYVVYALALSRGAVWYYCCGDVHPYYPVRYPAPLFSMEQRTPSKSWVYGYMPDHRDHQALFSFPTWVDDPFFYDHLTDLEAGPLRAFSQWKQRMDAE